MRSTQSAKGTSWSTADSDWASKHGWDVFVANGRYDIEKIDEKAKFKSDLEAVYFVRGMAAMGSSVARKALRLDSEPCYTADDLLADVLADMEESPK